MTPPIDPSLTASSTGALSHRVRLGRDDPILQELWAVKAAMNAEAGYSIEKLIERTHRFDLVATIDRLKHEAGE